MNALECIMAVNKDIFNGIKEFLVGIPNIFTMKFYEKHATGLIALAFIITIIVTAIGSLVFSVYIATTYFPDESWAYEWIPVVGLWLYIVLFGYVFALYQKCKESK